MVLLSMKTTGPYLKNKEHLTGSLSNIEKKNIKYVTKIYSRKF